jgi:hypothetical protein
MGKIIDHDLTAEDLGIVLGTLEIAPRFGLAFHWSDGVKVRGWNHLTPPSVFRSRPASQRSGRS